MQKYSRSAFTSLKNLKVFREGTMGLASGPSGSDGSIDVKAFDGRPQEIKEHYYDSSARAQPKRNTETHFKVTTKETPPLAPPKLPHPSSTPRLENVEVPNPAKPSFHQKRNSSAHSLDDVSCGVVDVGTWLEREKREQEEDSREYYKHHKASPLSEIKVVDTRKPVRRATDSRDPLDRDLYGWSPEQMDTAEGALERARRIWRENAMRGDPEAPHGRVLRALRGEWF